MLVLIKQITTSGEIQMTFKAGESGNPAGRPRGSRDKRTRLRSLLEPHGELLGDIIKSCV